MTVNCHTKVENSRVFVQLTKPRFNYSIYWQEEFNQSLEAKLKQKQLHMITPIDIGKALIEKQGGQVTIEKFGESGIAITFTLPIYKEKTPPPT
ncbi:MAG: hypothetical protein GY803_14940 [Chloroflexi bacterium]|nr:hypothetical protein [Chloroflexota bacterium]